MISPLELYNYLAACKSELTAIKTTKTVIDESQIVDKIRQLSGNDNQILLGVIPEYDGSPSTDIDSIEKNSYMAFLVLEKINYKSISTEKDEVLIWERTFQTMKKLEEKILKDAGGDCCECPSLAKINVGSINIDPVWKLAECNGYILSFFLTD